MFCKFMVLLSGQQGSGKTTTQQGLVRDWGKLGNHKACAVNFADPLYEMAEAVRTIAEKYGIPKKMPKDGPLLQVLGTEWGRNSIGENIWVNALKGKIKDVSIREGTWAYDESLAVVGDCRFRNEFDAFPDALRVRLNCPTALRKERCSAWRENDQHKSEVDLDQYNEEMKFDLYFDTSVSKAEGVVGAIIDALKAGVWKEKREQRL